MSLKDEIITLINQIEDERILRILLCYLKILLK